jgi:hypothetical protein
MSQAFYPPTRPLSIGEVLDLAVQIFKSTAIRCLPYGICAVTFEQLPNIYALGGGLAHQSFGGGSPEWMALFVLGTLLALTAWAALLLRQRAIIEHTPTGFKVELGATWRRLPVFVLATVLFLTVCGGAFVVPLAMPGHYRGWGRIALIPLSGYLAILLSCTWPAVLLAGLGPWGAVRQSVRLVWGNWWRVAAIYAVGAAGVLVLALMAGILIALVVPTLVADLPVMMAVFTVLANATVAVVAPFVSALLLAVFAELRVRKEGLDLQQRIGALAVE